MNAQIHTHHIDVEPPKANLFVFLELTWCFDCIHLSGVTFQGPPSWRYSDQARSIHRGLSRSASSPDLRDTDTLHIYLFFKTDIFDGLFWLI